MNYSWHNKLSFKSKLWQVWNWPSLGSIPLHYCWRMERLETKYKNLIITQQDGLVNQSTCSPTWEPRPSPETTRCRTTTDSSLFFSKFHISTAVCVLLPYQISKWNQENNKSLIECLSAIIYTHWASISSGKKTFAVIWNKKEENIFKACFWNTS